jgi:glycosyltransferase involved in cell wall biosynthesis
MSIVVLEAGAASLPVLFTDQCGVPEVAENRGGIEVAAEVGAIRDGLDRMSGADRALMGLRLRALVLKRYTWQSIAGRIEELYVEIIGPRPTT